MKYSASTSLSQAYYKYGKYYSRLRKRIQSGSFWRLSSRKRRMLFKRLQKHERKVHALESKFGWKRLAIPTVSSLLLFATQGVQATDYKLDEDFKSEDEEVMAINISNTTVDAYAPRGSLVGTLSGTAGENEPYSLVSSGDLQDDDNALFTIVDGDSLIVNDDIWAKGKSSLSIYVQGTGNTTPFNISLTVTNLPSSTGDRAFVDTGQSFGSAVTEGVKVGDMDLDGNLDVIELNSSDVTVRYGDGTGNFPTYYTYSIGSNNYLDVGDIDGDGDLDIVIGGFVTPSLPILYNQRAQAGSGFVNGGGGLYGVFLREVELVDTDQDGDLDIVASIGSSVNIYRNNNGFGGATIANGVGTQSQGMDFGDVDDDGDVDLLQAHSNGAIIYHGNPGYGNFGYFADLNPRDTLFNGAFVNDVFLADIDGDGDLDAFLMTGSTTYGVLAVENIDGTNWGVPQTIGARGYNATIGDVDGGDGDIDLIYKEYGGVERNMTIVNQGDFNFSTQLNGLPNGYRDKALGYFDGDSDLDVFLAASGPNKVFRNDLNNLITGISLSNSSLDVNSPLMTKVADLTATEIDGDPITFSLVNGTGDNHNGAFKIVDDSLVVNKELWVYGTSTMEVRIGANDGKGPDFEQTFTINLTGVPGNTHPPDFVEAGVNFGFKSKTAEVGDFDNDLNLDILQLADQRAILWYGDGTGAFPDSVSFIFTNPSANTYDLVVGDVDTDGDLDFIVTGYLYDNSVFLNQTIETGPRTGFDNSTAQPSLYGISFSLDLGDIDGDGDLDIVGVSGESSYFRRNDGTGSFYSDFSSGIYNNGYALDLGDVDNDGDLDVAIPMFGTIPVYLGNPEYGNFSGSFTLYGGSASDVLFSDVDGDGDLDAFISGNNTGSVFINESAQSFVNSGQLAGTYGKLSMGDADADGDVDLFMLEAGQFTMFTNDNGTFRKTNTKVGILNEVVDLVFGDFDGDGDLDAFASNNGAIANSQLIRNDVNNPITDITLSNTTVDAYATKGTVVGELSVTEVDGDPSYFTFGIDPVDGEHNAAFTIKDDSLIVNGDLYRFGKNVLDVNIKALDSLGSIFVKNIEITLDVPSSGGKFVDSGIAFENTQSRITRVADLDGDNNLDVLISYGPDVIIRKGDGAGGFAAPDTVGLASPGFFSDIEIGDLDLDGDIDMWIANNSGFPAVYLNDGAGNFTANTYLTFGGHDAVALADLDGDGDLDAIAAQGIYNYFYENKGGGDFASASGPQVFPETFLNFEFADFDKDSDLDFFLEANFIHVQTNDPNNSGNTFEFDMTEIQTFGSSQNDMELGDVNGDGFIDVVTEDSIFLYNDGTGLFENSGQFLGSNYKQITLGDVDGDGDLDMVIALYQGPLLGYNDGTGVFSFADTIPLIYTEDINFGDFDSDGDLDMYVSTRYEGPVPDVLLLNDQLPVEIVNTGITISIGDTTLISSAELMYTDGDNLPSELTYTVTVVPNHGQVENVSNAGVALPSFTQEDIDNNQIVYAHGGSIDLLDSIEFTITDGINDPIPGVFNISILPDVIPPSSTVDFLSTNDNTPPLTGTIDDNTATVSVTVDGTNYGATNNGDGTWDLADNTITTLADGFYDVVVIATDLSSNVDEDTTANALFIDTTLPVVSTDVLNTNDNTPPLTGTIDDNFASISINIDGSDYGATNNGDGTWTLADNTITTLADGIYDVTATATDTVGNVGVDNAIGAVTVDTTPPTVTIDALTTADTTPELTGTVDDNGATITVDVDIYSETATNNGDGTWTLADNTLGALALGIYDVTVTATDGLGNAGTDATTDELEIIVDPGRALDSAALVQVYTATGGPNWTDNTNWLTGALETWTGVTVTADRVTAVDLSSNDLTGTFPFITTGLDAATDLNLSDNELTDVGDLSNLTGLTSVDVTDNRLQFNTVGALLGGSYTLTYQTQKEVLAPIQILEQVGDPYTLDRTVAGADGYSWFKDGTSTGQTTATINIASLQTTDDGVYTVEATSSTITDLTLTTTEIDLRVSSLERDEKSLRLVYVGFADNTGISDWSGTSVSEWSEVTITDNRVTGLDISGLGVEGPMADDLLDVEGLQTVDISDNEITLIPDVTSLEGLTSFDASENPLDFASIEPNTDNAVTFEPLKPFGEETSIEIPAGDDTTFEFTVGGTTNIYQWVFRNDSLPEANQDFADVAGANNTVYNLNSISYETMGKYKLVVTNTQSDIELESKPKEVLAFGNVEFTPVFQFSDGTQGTVKEGEGKLYQITESGPYLGIDTVNVVNETIQFENVILGDYILNVRTEPDYEEIKAGVDTVSFIPTYFESTIDWVEADVLRLRDFISDELTIQRVPPETTGEGIVDLTVESDFADETSGRLEARRRVQKAGCSLRRRTTGGGGRPAQDDDEFVLIAYQETDENGEVNFGKLPNGFYRINIQYPGIPMDPESFVEFEINVDGGTAGYELTATILEDGIVVENVLGIKSDYFKDLNVYPVPARDEVTISYHRLLTEGVQIRLTDLNGKTMITRGLETGVNKTMKLDVRDLKGGVYLLQVFNDKEGTLAKYKIIVNK